MFGKKLGQALLSYLRRLWPFLIAVEVMFGSACLVVLFDRNPVEATGSMTFVGLSIMVASGYVIIGFIHAYASVNGVFSTETKASSQDLITSLWAQFVAFLVFLFFSGLLFLADVSMIAWKAVGQMFAAFDKTWYLFIQFLVYTAVVAATVFIVMAVWVALFRLDKQNKKLRTRTKIFGAIALFFGMASVICESALLVHNPSTDLLFLLGFYILTLVIMISVDAYMFVTLRRTVNAANNKEQTENANEHD